jgi:hypothetical protein
VQAEAKLRVGYDILRLNKTCTCCNPSILKHVSSSDLMMGQGFHLVNIMGILAGSGDEERRNPAGQEICPQYEEA